MAELAELPEVAMYESHKTITFFFMFSLMNYLMFLKLMNPPIYKTNTRYMALC